MIPVEISDNGEFSTLSQNRFGRLENAPEMYRGLGKWLCTKFLVKVNNFRSLNATSILNCNVTVKLKILTNFNRLNWIKM